MCALGTRPDSDGEQAWLEGGEGVVAGSFESSRTL